MWFYHLVEEVAIAVPGARCIEFLKLISFVGGEGGSKYYVALHCNFWLLGQSTRPGKASAQVRHRLGLQRFRASGAEVTELLRL